MCAVCGEERDQANRRRNNKFSVSCHQDDKFCYVYTEIGAKIFLINRSDTSSNHRFVFFKSRNKYIKFKVVSFLDFKSR